MLARTGEMDDEDDDGMGGNEEPGERRFDMNSEGVVRWTRKCDKRWDSANRCFVCLPEGESIQAEEENRLVFMCVDFFLPLSLSNLGHKSVHTADDAMSIERPPNSTRISKLGP